MWNAGDYAPQWIEADLGAPTELATLVLHMTQLPAGQTTHEVWISNEAIGEKRRGAKLAHTFTGHTDDNQRLQLEFPKGLVARYVQILTTRSPSWVAWVEVELRVQRQGGRYLCWSDHTNDRHQRRDTAQTLARLERYGPSFVVYPESPTASDAIVAPAPRGIIDRLPLSPKKRSDPWLAP
jgi:hypothetical protein